MNKALDADLLLSAYEAGYFPMAHTRASADISWYHPEKRGVLPLHPPHIPRRLGRQLRRSPFTLTVDAAFPEVIAACGEPTQKRTESWINPVIERLYTELWERGHAHSVEVWRDGQLVGGLYGVSIAGAFCGESMFSRLPGASKTALARLLKALGKAGYTLFDAQYVNPHLEQFGIEEIPREEYMQRLDAALAISPLPVFPQAL